MRVDDGPDGSPASLVVTGVLHNTGGRHGADVVQVYAQLPDPDAPGRLVAFARIEVAAGASEPFDLTVPLDRLATRDPHARTWLPPRGRHTLRVARHAEDSPDISIAVDL